MPTYSPENFRCTNKKCEHHAKTLRKYAWSDRTEPVKCRCGWELVEHYQERPTTFNIGKWSGMSSTERGKVLKKRAKEHSLKDRDKHHQMNRPDYNP